MKRTDRGEGAQRETLCENPAPPHHRETPMAALMGLPHGPPLQGPGGPGW